MSSDSSSPLARWLSRYPDDFVLRWVFALALSAAVCVLALDFLELNGISSSDVWATPIASPLVMPERPESADPRFGPAPSRGLGRAMTFDLRENGRLFATGVIDPGTAEAFIAEVAKRGSYIKTVVLDSPGGSVADALRMGRLIRQKGFATEVESRRTCASSCPLVLAGGAERRAGEKAAIGVHQVSAPAQSGGARAAGGGMQSAQRVSAEIQRYLRDMGIDLEVWVHAMETPKESLYFFKPEELLALKLTTERTGAKAAAPRDNRARS